MFKYNETKTKVALEEKEEGGHSRDYRVEKEVYMYPSYVI
jgi:hypothetical protein